MFNTKNSDRSNWVIQREYQDSQGIVQTEYRDSQGNIHVEAKDPNQPDKSYQSGHTDGILLEKHSQNEQLNREDVADRKVSRGLLVGLIIAGVMGITGAMAYYLYQLNDPSPVTVVTTPIYKTEPAPNPSPPVVEKSVTNITPAEPTQSKPPDVNVTVVNEPEAPKPAAPPKTTPSVVQKVQPAKPATTAVKPPAQKAPAPAIANPSPQAAPKPIASMPPVAPPSNAPGVNTAPNSDKTDTQLKSEIVQEFNKQFFSNQLLVNVNQGNVKVSGTVDSPEQLDKIQPLLRSMEGVKTIDVRVTPKISSN